MKAIWNGKIIAESDQTKNVKGNQYFPADTVNKDAAWYYPDPSEKAMPIKDYSEFWRGIEIQN